MGGRLLLGNERQLQMIDDPIDSPIVRDESDKLHRFPVLRTDHRIDKVVKKRPLGTAAKIPQEPALEHGHRIRANPQWGLPQSKRRCEERSDVAISCPRRGTMGSPRPCGPRDDLRSLSLTIGRK